MDANMLTIRKPFEVWCPTRATLASPTSIDGQEPSSGTRSLVRKLLKERGPSCIVYRFRKQPTGQTFYLQVFDKNQPVVVDQVSGQLVLKIVALVEDFAGESWLPCEPLSSSAWKTSLDVLPDVVLYEDASVPF
jgi:hypothetical protein